MGKIKTIMTVLPLACLFLGMNSCMKSDLDDIRKELQELENQINESASQDMSVSFDSEDVFYASPAGNEIALQLPETLKESEFSSITAMVSVLEGSDVQTRGVGDKWTVNVTKPSFDADGNVVPGSAKVTIKGTEDTSLSETFILQVIISTKDGKEMTGSHFVKYTAGTIASSVTDLTDNNITHLAWKGSITAEDFEYIRTNLKLLKVADLSMAETTEIPSKAFYDAASLRKVWLPSTITIIREKAFSNTGLEYIDLANVQEFENSVFVNCKNLKSIDIPASVTTLGRWIFEGCANLKDITLHEGLTTLSASTFYGCGITEIDIPTTVSEIPDYCFGETKLTTITIPSTVKSVGFGAFFGCTDLTSANIEADLNEIPPLMFYICSSLQTVNLPESITSIGNDVFVNCPLKFENNKLVIPSKVESIGERAFSDCKSITSIELPEGLKEIKPTAFGNIENISEIVLPSTLEKMADCAFCYYNYSKLSKVTFKGTTPPEVIYNTDADGNYSKPNVEKMQSCQVYVPASAIEAYKKSEWFQGTYAYDSQSYPGLTVYFNEDNLNAIE